MSFNDLYFWKTILKFGIPVLVVLFWFKSGRSPFFWLSVGFAWLEAVRFQFCRSCAVAYHHFKKEFPDAVRVTRGEISTFDEVDNGETT